jgi:hypothetical protein
MKRKQDKHTHMHAHLHMYMHYRKYRNAHCSCGVVYFPLSERQTVREKNELGIVTGTLHYNGMSREKISKPEMGDLPNA